MQQPAPAYCGNEPYVFVCYSHEDKALVYPQIAWLQSQGANVWYDEGISPGKEWSDELGQAIDHAAWLVFFVTPKSVASRHCRNEVHFAQNHDTPVLAVHLQETILPAGIELAIGSSQGIPAHAKRVADWRRELIRALEPQAAPKETAPTPKTVSSQRRYWLISSLILLVVGIMGAHMLFGNGAPDASRADMSVSVAPLKTFRSNSELTGIAAYLRETLTDSLIGYPEIRVLSKAGMDPQSHATARYQVTGSIQMTDAHLAIRLRLQRKSDEQAVWSDEFRVPTGEMDVGDIDLNEVATNAARFVRVEIPKDAECERVRQRGHPPEAVDLFCRGLDEWYRYNQGGAQDWRLMVSSARQALAIDSAIAEAYPLVMSGPIYQRLFGELSPQEASRRAHDIAREGLKIRANNASLLWVRSIIEATVDLNFEAADASAREALRVDPLHPDAAVIHGTLGRIAMFRNDVPAALDHYRRAVRINDSIARIHQEYANALRIAGLHEESLKAARAAINLVNRGAVRMMAIQAIVDTNIAMGRVGEAAAALDLVNQSDKAVWTPLYAVVVAASRNTSEAYAIWSDLAESGTKLPEYAGVFYSLAVGNRDEAFRWLHRAVDVRSEGVLEYLGIDPRFDPLRSDSRWQEIMTHFEASKLVAGSLSPH